MIDRNRSLHFDTCVLFIYFERSFLVATEQGLLQQNKIYLFTLREVFSLSSLVSVTRYRTYRGVTGGDRLISQFTSRHIQQDFINFDPSAFQETDFKFIDDLPCDRHFSSMKIIPVQELVYYGFHLQEKEQDLQDTDNAPINKEDLVAPLHQGGIHLNPKDYHDKLKMNNTVVIDERNHYEAAIGRFDGAPGADYIDPKMRKSTDFAQWIQNSEIQEISKGNKY